MPTFGPMYMESPTVAWIAANDGIYNITNGVMTQVCTNASNWTITGIGMIGSTLYFSTSQSNSIYSKSSPLSADINGFTPENSGTPLGTTILCLTANGSSLFYMDNRDKGFIKRGSNPASLQPLSLPGYQIASNQISMFADNNYLYVNAVNTVWRYTISIDYYTETYVPTSSLGQIAADSNGEGNVFIATNGVREYNKSFLIGGQSSWTQLTTFPIVSISMKGNAGYVVDTTGSVYSFTSSSTALATGLPQPPTTTLPPPPSVQLTFTNSVSDIVPAIGFTPPSTGLPRWASMVVLGGEVASISPLTRAVISRANFDAILAARYGGVLTPAISYNCQFLNDSVNVPVRY